MLVEEIYKIHKTCTPSEIPVVVDVKNVLLITMTCGGGIGGAQWKELVLDEDCKITSNELHTFIDAISGKEVTLNSHYIVKIEPKQVLKVYDDITAHRNYSKIVCKRAWNERFIVLDRGQKWECVEKYSSDRNEVFKTLEYQEK